MRTVAGVALDRVRPAGTRPMALLQRGLVYLGAAFAALVLVGIVGYICVMGIPELKPSLFEWEYNSNNVTAETLQGIPSIIYGLFGALFFVGVCKMGLSLLSGACTLAIMVLPVIMRTTEEALLAVPDAYRQGGYGLGAGRVRTVFRCVLPSAMPGILGGVILALGRCVGEVAALIFTAGSIAAIPNFVAEGPAAVLDSARTLAVHMYVLSSEGLHIGETYATAVVLLVLVLLINLATTATARRMNKGVQSD